MKKTILAALMCLGLGSQAFAGELFEYSANPQGMIVAQAPVPQVPYVINENFPNEGRIAENVRAVAYGIEIIIEVNDRPVKEYNIPADTLNQFVIVNGENVPYVSEVDRTKGIRDYRPVYDMAKDGIAIRGDASPGAPGYTNIRLNIFQNDLTGFQPSCRDGKWECIDLPQALFTRNDVMIQAPFNQQITATNLVNSRGDKITVKVRVTDLVLDAVHKQ